MSVIERLSRWWQGRTGDGASISTVPQGASSVPSAHASANEPEPELDRLMAAYRNERAAQMVSSSGAGVERSLDDLRDFYVTTGRDLTELNRFVAEVDEDLFSQYAAG